MEKMEAGLKNSGKGALMNLFLGFSVYQFALHVFFLLVAKDPRVILPTAISFVHDLLVLSLYYVLAGSTCRLLPAGAKKAGENLFSAGFIMLGGLLALYPRLLREILIFPVNIFEPDVGTAKTFIFDYLGFRQLIPVFLALAFGLALVSTKKRFGVPPKIRTIGFVIILILSLLFLKNHSPQPIVYSFQVEAENLINGKERAVPSLTVSEKEDSGRIVALDYPKKEVSGYEHVLMIVLEGVPARDFESEFVGMDGGFFQRNRERAAYYGNYHATNLDSYTSLIAMMSGIQVPYRSYSDADAYDKVNDGPNLADFFNKNGFESSFVSTFEYQPFIPSKEFWRNVFVRKDFDNVGNFTSIGSSRMEMATEDKVAIPKIVGEMKKSNKTFILHEMAYGHSPEWRAKMGKTTLRYYDEYLTELSGKLKEENLFDRTLFVIVSDHGYRTTSEDPANYRVPLLFVGNNVKADTNARFLSHVDLPRMIYYFLGVGSHPSGADRIFLVGSSEKWVYGALASDGAYLFIDDARGVVLSRSNNTDPSAIRSEFQKYLAEFNYKYGKKG